MLLLLILPRERVQCDILIFIRLFCVHWSGVTISGNAKSKFAFVVVTIEGISLMKIPLTDLRVSFLLIILVLSHFL